MKPRTSVTREIGYLKVFFLRRRRHDSIQRRAGSVTIWRARRVTDSPCVIEKIIHFQYACARSMSVIDNEPSSVRENSLNQHRTRGVEDGRTRVTHSLGAD